MAKRHDENRDLRSVSRIAKVNIVDKTIQANKSTTIGIHMWGKIDFLTHYCGWHFIWNNNAGVGGYVNNDTYTSTKTKEDKKQRLNKQRKSYNKNNHE